MLEYASENNIKKIISYCDMRYTNIFKPVYEKLGFSLIGKIEPSKFYIKNNIKFPRQKFQKHKLNDRLNDGLLENLNGSTAQEIMFNNGYRVFYDSGNLKYIKLIK